MNPPLPALTPRERAALAPREPLSIEHWARRHLRVVEGPLVGSAGESVPFDPESFPLQRAIMEAIEDPRWARVLLMTAPQAFGKTQCAALPTLLHALEHRRVSALYVAANLDLAVTQWRRKIQKAMLADLALKELFFDNVDFGGNRTRRDFTNSTSLHCAGADSAGALAGFTVPVIVCDDIQAYPDTLPGFGHPADLAFKRSAAMPAEATTHVGIGTAGTVKDYLWRSMQASAMFVPMLPCPHCGAYQLLEWERLEYDEADVETAKQDTKMRCVGNGECGMRNAEKGLNPEAHSFTFDDLPGMLAEHRWVSVPPDEDWITGGMRNAELGMRKEEGYSAFSIQHSAFDIYPATRRNTNVAGFWCNALYWPWGDTWGERAADFIGRRGDPDKLLDHQQHVRVVPYTEPEEDEDALTPEALEAHRTGYKCGTVPSDADLLILTVDVHANFLYFIARAWRRADGTSWLVEADHPGVHGVHKGEDLTERQRKARVGHGIREALDELYERMLEGWPVVKDDGEVVRVHHPSVVLVDGRFRPDVVGPLCRLRSSPRCRWIMTMGAAGGRKPKPIWPRKGFRDKRGYGYREINVDAAKLALRDALAVPPGRASGWRTYADKDLAAYHRHLCSEHYIPKRPESNEMVWRPRPGGGPNHWLDCEVLQIAAAIACRVRLGGAVGPPPPRPPQGRRSRMTTPDGRPFLISERE